METTLPSFPASNHNDREGLAIHSSTIPVYVYATVFASFCVITGLIWDICWHISIGRDGLLSPPHLVIYLGAVVAGLFSGYEILRKTFAGRSEEKAASVRVWGFFYSSLGSLFCVWGALMMLTSAPFDDWWHNTYGLDVQILSPPHTVLILGIIGIQFGAMICVIAVRNQLTGKAQTSQRTENILFALFALSAGFLLTIWFTLLSEELGKMDSHNSSYYICACAAFPVLLLAAGKAYPHKWTVTAVAGVNLALMLGTLWIIPLFPAEPKLGPILHHIDHYQGFQFPLLLILPAIAIDVLRQRLQAVSVWRATLIYGAVFWAIFLPVHWILGGFLMESVYARNWFFGSHYWYFGNNPNWEFRYKFAEWMLQEPLALAKGLAIALILSFVSARVGLSWGSWMRKIVR